jgi:hypothetical protein
LAISTVKIKIAGTEYSLVYNGTSGKWEKSINAPGATSWGQPGGVYACEVTATNGAGTSTTVTTSTPTIGNNLKLRVKETVKPVITISSPSSGAFVTNNKQPVVATLIDEANGSGIDLSTLVVKVDGTTVSTGVATTAITNGYSLTYTPASALSDGSHTVTIDVSDHDGNAAVEKSTTYTVDTVPPTLNVTSPAEGAILASASVGYAGTTNDSTSSPVTIAVTLDGAAQTAPTVSGGAFAGTLSNVSDGAHTLVITATDAAGKYSTVTRSFTVDTTAPVISAVSITPNPADTGTTMIVSVTIE